MLVLKNDFISKEIEKAEQVALFHESKQRRADARIMLQLLEVARKVLPNRIDLTTLTFSTYGVSVASLTTLIQKNLKRERFYIFAKNKTHIKEISGSVLILVIKATNQTLLKVKAEKLQNNEISLKYLNNLLDNGYACEVENNLL